MTETITILICLALAGCTTLLREERYEDGYMTSSKIRIMRSWGTNTAEFKGTTETSEASVGGEGMSNNLRGVAGDNVLGGALQTFLKLYAPLSPGQTPPQPPAPAGVNLPPLPVDERQANETTP